MTTLEYACVKMNKRKKVEEENIDKLCDVFQKNVKVSDKSRMLAYYHLHKKSPTVLQKVTEKYGSNYTWRHVKKITDMYFHQEMNANISNPLFQ